MLLLLFTYSVILSLAQAAFNYSPIIGVFTQPTNITSTVCKENCLYIAASYVKYLESAGARVVPINYYATEDALDTLLKNLNGVLFPGGSAAFPNAAQYVFDEIKAMNDNGDYMPLWGTCMGFEWLLISASRNISILDPATGVLDADNLSISLDFTINSLSSKIFSTAPRDVLNILAKENVTMNNHHYGIYPTHFQQVSQLKSLFSILSTNKDRQGVEFVSTIEAIKYPIFGSQWHPEKNIFEWGKTTDGMAYEAINHSPNAVFIAQYMANFFVQQSRKNNHHYLTEQEEYAALIYNYTPVKTTDISSSFVQIYLFHS